MKTKFNNHVTKAIFYPGQKIIVEGSKDTDKMYVIVEGECKIVCTKTNDKFKDLEHLEDPTRAKREIERKKRINPYKK